jgi:hypothetical protein
MNPEVLRAPADKLIRTDKTRGDSPDRLLTGLFGPWQTQIYASCQTKATPDRCSNLHALLTRNHESRCHITPRG